MKNALTGDRYSGQGRVSPQSLAARRYRWSRAVQMAKAPTPFMSIVNPSTQLIP
ncbi:MAG: hypothetical protein ACJ789_14580 [Thermomicrobiales bacterium]